MKLYDTENYKDFFFFFHTKTWNHTEKYLQSVKGNHMIITLKYFPLFFKDTEITL